MNVCCNLIGQLVTCHFQGKIISFSKILICYFKNMDKQLNKNNKMMFKMILFLLDLFILVIYFVVNRS